MGDRIRLSQTFKESDVTCISYTLYDGKSHTTLLVEYFYKLTILSLLAALTAFSLAS
jgi:hypothetical protein